MSQLNAMFGDRDTLRAQLRMVTRSARVLRYHCEPVLRNQSVGEHTYGVMWLIMLMTNGLPSAQLLSAALMHDMHEYVTGDVPAPTKKLAGVKGLFDNMEASIEKSVNFEMPTLLPEEEWLLKMADVLEGLAFCAFELRQGNREIFDCFRNYADYARKQLATAPSKNIVASLIVEKYVREFTQAFSGADDGK